jgi:translation initiation factor 4E
MEHGLENSWTLYVTKMRKNLAHEKNQKEWEDRLERIHTYQTVESFWSVYSNLKTPSEMSNEVGDYYLFKENILPEWEHESNSQGGRWILNSTPNKVDEYWLKLQLSLLGNMHEDAMQYICGAEVAIRKKNRFKITVWIQNVDKSTAVKIGQKIKDTVETNSLDFQKHGSDKIEFSIN